MHRNSKLLLQTMQTVLADVILSLRSLETLKKTYNILFGSRIRKNLPKTPSKVMISWLDESLRDCVDLKFGYGTSGSTNSETPDTTEVNISDGVGCRSVTDEGLKILVNGVNPSNILGDKKGGLFFVPGDYWAVLDNASTCDNSLDCGITSGTSLEVTFLRDGYYYFFYQEKIIIEGSGKKMTE